MANCKGSMQLRTGCGRCDRCLEEIASYKSPKTTCPIDGEMCGCLYDGQYCVKQAAPAPVGIERKHSAYFKPCPYDYIDVYRVLEMWEVKSPPIEHAIKKLLVAGGRGGGKDVERDIQESIDALVRWQEMRKEDGKQVSASAAQSKDPAP
jgi:hypothetical protein